LSVGNICSTEHVTAKQVELELASPGGAIFTSAGATGQKRRSHQEALRGVELVKDKTRAAKESPAILQCDFQDE
jgi:hypothetical protein